MTKKQKAEARNFGSKTDFRGSEIRAFSASDSNSDPANIQPFYFDVRDPEGEGFTRFYLVSSREGLASIGFNTELLKEVKL